VWYLSRNQRSDSRWRFADWLPNGYEASYVALDKGIVWMLIASLGLSGTSLRGQPEMANYLMNYLS
jgi:hypothetical protein